jgi:hypothetical protein
LLYYPFRYVAVKLPFQQAFLLGYDVHAAYFGASFPLCKLPMPRVNTPQKANLDNFQLGRLYRFRLHHYYVLALIFCPVLWTTYKAILQERRESGAGKKLV